MDTRALIENIESYTGSAKSGAMSHDSRSNPSFVNNPSHFRRRAFDSNFYFDEHTKRRAAVNRSVHASPQKNHQINRYEKEPIHHVYPSKNFQGVSFHVPEIRDDIPTITRDSCSSQKRMVAPLEDSLIEEQRYTNESKLVDTDHGAFKSVMENTPQGHENNFDSNALYWTTIAIKVAQSIVMHGGMLHHAEAAQMVILDCAKDLSISARMDGATFIASKLSTALLELNADEFVVTKATTMYLKCVSMPTVSMIEDIRDYSEFPAKIKKGIHSGAHVVEKGVEIGTDLFYSFIDILTHACSSLQRRVRDSSRYSRGSDYSEDEIYDDNSYDSTSYQESTNYDTRVRRKR